MKIKLIGYQKEPIEIETLDINVEYEGYVWLRMVDKSGGEYQTGLLKEARVE